ncbi:hypothetical protein HYC85_009136 [Camellia sinensis]|uniref:PB1 domain-containing protein n=1 Tax=Camellia sinensis TaxID=4442 RepID=A0A7J7HE58_CAMSI|nr:hypothetical protein HYC85_009136 [Camellia sinensis]
MENYSYPTSYPDSGNSSPRSREIDFENTPPWEEQAAAPPSSNYKVKFMCSYGGKIHPRSHDNLLSYIGGETKILAVDRNIKFAGLIGKLSVLCDADVCFKYQLPGEDLDALISVTNDDDLEHMMHEYDRLFRASSKPARLRLFLFADEESAAASQGSFGSSEGKSDRERFVDALNSGPIQAPPPPPPSTVAPPPMAPPPNNVDFLFGLDKGMPVPVPVPVPVAAKVPDPIPEPEIPAPPPEDHPRQIQDFQRLQIGGQEQAMYWRRNDENLIGGFSGNNYYGQNFSEKLPPATLPAAPPPPVSAPQGYWPEKQLTGGGVYTAPPEQQQQQVYMIQTPAGMYHAPMGRQVTGQAGQGYYAVQRMQPEVYRDQASLYNVAPPQPAVAQPTLPQQPQPQQPAKMAGYAEGFGMVRQANSGGVGMVETTGGGYTQMAYDAGAGRQVYYAAQGGAVQSPPYQAMGVADMRQGGGLNNQDVKAAAKASQQHM